jgi:hypothetical protein
MGRGPTQKQFWSRAEALLRLAELRTTVFEGDSPEAMARRKAEAIVLPEVFNRTYLPHYFREVPAAMHLEWYRALEADRFIAVRAPRGFSKSTVITFAYGLHQAVCGAVLRQWQDGTLEAEDPALFRAIHEVMEEQGRDIALHWDPYIQIIAVTFATAQEFTESIKLELERNDRLRSDWGVLVRDEGVNYHDFVTTTDVRVRAFGMEGAIRGGKHGPRRPTLALMDDLDSKRTAGRPEQTGKRDAATRKINGGVKFGLEPGVSRVFMVGTPSWHDCQIVRFCDPKRFTRFRKLRYHCWDDWRKTSAWPERWPAEDLLAELNDDPETFGPEMEDQEPSAEGRIFTSWSTYSRLEYARRPGIKVLAFDPALGGGDDQAVGIARFVDGHFLAHRIELLNICDEMELVDRVLAIAAEEDCDLHGIEAIGFQRLMTVLLTLRGGAQGFFIGWEQIVYQGESKDMRLRGLAALARRGQFRLPDDGSCVALRRQGDAYPHGKKDGLDVFEMCRQLVHRSHRGHGLAHVEHVPGRRSHFGKGAW